MLDTDTGELNTNSKSNLIDVQHVGVTAKLQSPLKSFLLNYSSSTESENNKIFYRDCCHSNTKYNKFLNEATNETDTTTSDASKALYEMKSVTEKLKKSSNNKLTPTKIEFQLYTKPKKRLRKDRVSKATNRPQKNKKAKDQLLENKSVTLEQQQQFPATENSLLKYLKNSFSKKTNSKKAPQPATDQTPFDSTEPKLVQEYNIGIYPFEHGCAEYLKTHECPPRISSLALAERATRYATRFWAEFFGSIQIAIIFLVTFLLQSYRFALYSIVNIFMVEVLHLTSDYFIKPLLAVLFNGFLQPPLIFCFNILSLTRDILEPIADTINNFMKPIATLGRSIRLVHATYNKNKRTLAKNV